MLGRGNPASEFYAKNSVVLGHPNKNSVEQEMPREEKRSAEGSGMTTLDGY